VNLNPGILAGIDSSLQPNPCTQVKLAQIPDTHGTSVPGLPVFDIGQAGDKLFSFFPSILC